MSAQIRYAQVYQLSLQLVCISDRWDQKLKSRRTDLSLRLMEATTALVLLLAEEIDSGEHPAQSKFLERANIKVSVAAALIDVSGVLHLVSPAELQKARAVIRKLRRHLFVLQSPNELIAPKCHAQAG